MVKPSLSVVILTTNEEKNILKCLESIKNVASEIIVIDGYSTDKTLDIAKRFGAKVKQHTYVNQDQQFNWALDNVPIHNEWILRLDADEEILPELADEIRDTLLETPLAISGFYMKRRVYFMGRWIKHGGYYPTWILRLFRKGKARSEGREMDEHIILLAGKAGHLKNDFVDDNRNGLKAWIEKQNGYSTREVSARLKDSGAQGNFAGEQAERKRWIKKNFYSQLPKFFRAFLYFLYRYFIRLGFLDGKEGLIFHFLQGFWHLFVIDAKIYELEKKGENRN